MTFLFHISGHFMGFCLPFLLTYISFQNFSFHFPLGQISPGKEETHSDDRPRASPGQESYFLLEIPGGQSAILDRDKQWRPVLSNFSFWE